MGAPRVSGPADMSHPPCDCFDEPDGVWDWFIKQKPFPFFCEVGLRPRMGDLSMLSGLWWFSTWISDEWWWQSLDGGDSLGAIHRIVLFFVVMVQAWLVVMVRFSVLFCY